MNRRTQALLLFLTLPTLTEPTTRVEGDHFAVVCDFDSKAIAEAALAQIEKLWTPAAELYDLPPDALTDKLVLHLYRDARGYRKADNAMTGGAFQRNLAFAHFDTVSAHVALQPEVSNEVLARVGLSGLTRSMILHEAAHLVRTARCRTAAVTPVGSRTESR